MEVEFWQYLLRFSAVDEAMTVESGRQVRMIMLILDEASRA